MQRVRLIHWKESEAEEKVEILKKAGYKVETSLLDPDSLRQMRQDPPAAFVIDLDRLPSQGRDFALGIRIQKTTRNVPLVFVGGELEKVKGIKELLPDAVYTQWGQIDDPLRTAIDSPPTDPVVPTSVMAGYSGTPLPKKLGIKENTVVALVNAPKGLKETLGELPEGAVLRTGLQSIGDLTLWFVRERNLRKACVRCLILVIRPGCGSSGRRSPLAWKAISPRTSCGRLALPLVWWISRSVLLIKPGLVCGSRKGRRLRRNDCGLS
jgi:hypothetical protein